MMFYFSTGSHEFFFTTHADLYCLLEYEVTMIKSKNYVTCDIIEFVKEMHSSITSMMLQLSMTLALRLKGEHQFLMFLITKSL